MLTAAFVWLSALTGLEIVPLQNLACGVLGSVGSPLMIAGARRAYAACQRTPKPVSVLCSRILNQLSQTGWDLHYFTGIPTLLECVTDGNIAVYQNGDIRVDGHQTSQDLPRHEGRLILKSAASVRDTLLAQVESDRKAAIMAALRDPTDGTDQDKYQEEDPEDTELDQTDYLSAQDRNPSLATRPSLMKR
jgi:hypothetical protein